jgi:hypothetical protein
MSAEDKYSDAEKSLHDIEIERKIEEKISKLEGRLLTSEEIIGLRKLMEQDARTRWFWSSLRTWVLALSAIIAMLTVGLDGVKTILRRLIA